MSGLLVLRLDGETAAHLAVALHRYRGRLAELGYSEPVGLAELETVAVSVAKRQQASSSGHVVLGRDDGLDAREYLSRADIRWRTGASLSTVDRWIRDGALPSVKRGRLRRVRRVDLERFLAAGSPVAAAGDAGPDRPGARGGRAERAPRPDAEHLSPA